MFAINQNIMDITIIIKPTVNYLLTSGLVTQHEYLPSPPFFKPSGLIRLTKVVQKTKQLKKPQKISHYFKSQKCYSFFVCGTPEQSFFKNL